MKPTFPLTFCTFENISHRKLDILNDNFPHNSCGGIAIVNYKLPSIINKFYLQKTTFYLPYDTDPTKLELHFSELNQVFVQ